MEIALIHKESLLLGPLAFNIRMINSDLGDLDITERVFLEDYENIPIHFSDGFTHLLPIEKCIPEHNTKYHNVGNFTWEIIKEDDVPTKVVFTYPIIDKTIEEVKEIRKTEIVPIRKIKENTTITVVVSEKEIVTDTSREERMLISSKLSAAPNTYNYKFKNGWFEVTTEQLQYILTQIDNTVQAAFDWEMEKLQEIDACETIDDVYAVVIAV